MMFSRLQSPPTTLPPGPVGLPYLGSVFSALKDPIALFTSITNTHGDIASMEVLGQRYILLNEPDSIRHVLATNAKNYEKSRNYAGLRVMLGEGLLTSEGERWKRQRRLVQPAFHRDKLATFVEAMVLCTKDTIDRWKKTFRSETTKIGEPFDAHEEMMRLTLRVVGKTLLSQELEGEARAIGEALTETLTWANKHVESIVRIPPKWPTPANRRMWKMRKRFDDLIYRLIAERRREGSKPDLLSMLIDARDEDGSQMSDLHLRDELLTMVAAGHETTANALSFAIYLLSSHPIVMRKLEAEVARVLGDRDPTLADIPKLSYATMVASETMRLYPPAWAFERRALGPDRVGDFDIPADATIGVSPFVLHRNPRLWENPCGFDPERFNPDVTEKRHKHAYLPFGAGPRTCIGNAFAMMEMTIVIAMLARSVQLDLVPGHELALDPAVTLRPKTGVWVRLG